MTNLEAAREIHNAAFYKFDEIRTSYRDGKISDAEFLAAKAEYDAAGAAYDAAIDAAAEAPEAIDAEIFETEAQLAFF